MKSIKTRKFISLSLISCTLLSSSVSFADSVNDFKVSETKPSVQKNINITNGKKSDNLKKVSKESLIETIKPYINVTKKGTITFKKNLPENYYEEYELEKLQEHFDNLNTLSKSGRITINKDLSITENLTSARAVYGSWTYHWWGYDRKFTSSQSKDYILDLQTAASGAAIVAAATTAFPPVAGIAAIDAGYWSLLATRVAANDKGRGVYVGITWALVFNVDPL